MRTATIVLLVINALLLAANIGIQVAIVKYEVEDLKVQTVVNHALQAEIQDLQDRTKILEKGSDVSSAASSSNQTTTRYQSWNGSET